MEDDLTIRCNVCQVELTEENCYTSNDKKYRNRKGFLHKCKSCQRDARHKWMDNGGREKHRVKEAKRRIKAPERYLWLNAKQRSESKNIPFNIEERDIIIPEKCPVLGIDLKFADGERIKRSDHSPSLDRIKPELGYTKGNIIVVSLKANRIKTDASLEELKKVFDFYSTY